MITRRSIPNLRTIATTYLEGHSPFHITPPHHGCPPSSPPSQSSPPPPFPNFFSIFHNPPTPPPPRALSKNPHTHPKKENEEKGKEKNLPSSTITGPFLQYMLY